MLKYKLCWKNRPLRELFIYQGSSTKPTKLYKSATYTTLKSISRQVLCKNTCIYFFSTSSCIDINDTAKMSIVIKVGNTTLQIDFSCYCVDEIL